MSGAVLVTGAHGAIGSWVVRELVGRGVPVVAYDSAPVPVTPFPAFAAVTTVVADVRETERLAGVIREHGVTRIIHLAALLLENADRQPAEAIAVNSLATANLLALARELGVGRVISNSTKGALGALEPAHLHPTYLPVPVDHPAAPRTIYETTKYLVEVAVRAERTNGLSCAAIRLSTTWGPGKSGATHAGMSVHADLVAAALRGESPVIDVHPEQGYDLVYYADIAAGLAGLALAPGELRSPVYHLGGGQITTMGAFAAAVERTFPGVRVTLGTRFPPGRNCLLDIGPAAADGGYAPRFDPAAALADIRRLAGGLD